MAVTHKTYSTDGRMFLALTQDNVDNKGNGTG